MKPEDWDPEVVRAVAKRTGKPLEVECAMAFEGAGWEILLGPYYEDPVDAKLRELDVFAQRKKKIEGAKRRFNLWLHAIASCKGTRENESVVTYSVGGTSLSIRNHELLHTEPHLSYLLLDQGVPVRGSKKQERIFLIVWGFAGGLVMGSFVFWPPILASLGWN